MNITTQTDDTPESENHWLEIAIDNLPSLPVSFFCSEKELAVVRSTTELCRINWSKITEFTVKQIGQNFMQLVIRSDSGKVLDINLPLPAHSLGSTRILDELNSRVPAERKRFYRLLRPGVAWQIKSVNCKVMIAIGYCLAAPSASIFAAIIFIDLYAKMKVWPLLLDSNELLSLLFLILILGIALIFYGWKNLRRIQMPVPEKSGKEPVIFSKQSRFSKNRATYITELLLESTTVAIISLIAGLSLTSFFKIPVDLILVLVSSLFAGFLYLPCRFRHHDFESVVLTEGRVIIHFAGHLLLNEYIHDCTAEVNPHNGQGVIFHANGKSVAVHNHRISGDYLLTVFHRLKSGEKLRPILSEEHPGFKFEYNDAE